MAPNKHHLYDSMAAGSSDVAGSTFLPPEVSQPDILELEEPASSIRDATTATQQTNNNLQRSEIFKSPPRSNVDAALSEGPLALPLPVSKWSIILYGQVMALCLATCSISSAALQSIQVQTVGNMKMTTKMPLFQLSSAYISLAFHLLFLKRQECQSSIAGASHAHWDSQQQETEEGKQIHIISSPYEQQQHCNHNAKARGKLNRDAPTHSDWDINVIGGNENTSLLETTAGGTTSATAVPKPAKLTESASNHHLCLWNRIHLQAPWYFYALLAFLDVQANFFVVLSFRYTAVVSSTLLTSLSIVSVITTSRLMLGRRYHSVHFAGALSCILGASCIVTLDSRLSSDTTDTTADEHFWSNGSFSDQQPYESTEVDPDEEGSRLLGDFFAIAAALLFGLNDALAEYSIQNSTPNEYLGMLGLFGFLFSFSQSLIFERDQLDQFMIIWKSFLIDSGDVGAGTVTHCSNGLEDDCTNIINMEFLWMCTIWVAYILTFYLFYVSASHFLIVSDATMMSLSLQAANVWTCLYSIFVQKMAFTPLLFCSISLIIFGVWLYERQGPSSIKNIESGTLGGEGVSPPKNRG